MAGDPAHRLPATLGEDEPRGSVGSVMSQRPGLGDVRTAPRYCIEIFSLVGVYIVIG